MTKDAHYGLAAVLVCLSAIGLSRHLDKGIAAPRAASTAPVASSAANALRDGEALDLNRANVADLTLLPGVGTRVAERIVAERSRVGRFVSVDQLLGVQGIGQKTVARIRPLVRIASKQIKSARATQLNLSGGAHVLVDEQHAQPEVQAKQPCPTREVIDADRAEAMRRDR
jgi:competence ComEA-like helix-hairpin-helix protein